jgi:NAD(P)-dependent dehydrogenase (short-subunit alcohol dehydrogenase family)
MPSSKTRWLVTGASRGIGLALVSQLAEAGDTVFAACRTPEDADALTSIAERQPNLTVVALDVTDDAAVAAAVEAVSAIVASIDVLVNNAGINFNDTLSDFDAARMLRTFDVNTVGAMRMLTGCRPLLSASDRPRVVNVSSQLGSLTAQAPGFGWMAYNASKAALNVATRQASFALAGDGVVVVAVNPGWVRTDMCGEEAPVTPSESAAGIVALARRITLSDSGKFLVYDGTEHAW